jgi:hypothetical protein
LHFYKKYNKYSDKQTIIIKSQFHELYFYIHIYIQLQILVRKKRNSGIVLFIYLITLSVRGTFAANDLRASQVSVATGSISVAGSSKPEEPPGGSSMV